MGSDFFESFPEIQNNLKTDRPHVGIGANTFIRKAILDKNVRIGNNVRLINKDGAAKYDAPNGSIYIRDGTIIVPKNAVIPHGTEI